MDWKKKERDKLKLTTYKNQIENEILHSPTQNLSNKQNNFQPRIKFTNDNFFKVKKQNYKFNFSKIFKIGIPNNSTS